MNARWNGIFEGRNESSYNREDIIKSENICVFKEVKKDREKCLSFLLSMFKNAFCEVCSKKLASGVNGVTDKKGGLHLLIRLDWKEVSEDYAIRKLIWKIFQKSFLFTT